MRIRFDDLQTTVRIVGGVLESRKRGMDMFTSTRTVAAAGPSLAESFHYDLGLQPGTSATTYAGSGQLGGPPAVQ